MFKNLTPRQIATYSASVIGVLVALSSVVLFYLLHDKLSVMMAVLVVMVICASYFVNLFFLKKYIFRKIKLIYKSIHSLKLDPRKKQKSIDGDDQIIEDVEKEVASWAYDRQQEIEHLQTLENYRREFLGNVSHELKTPIFNIQGYLHTLIDGGIDDPKVNLKYLNRSAKNVERLITIVDDLETISKLESGNLVLDIRKFDIKDLVDEVFEAHELLAQSRNISLVYKEGASQHFQVKADKDYIRQVLDNLVVNSLKYGKEGGFTKLSFYDMDKYILVEVADNGLGIGQEHLKYVLIDSIVWTKVDPGVLVDQAWVFLL